MNMNKHARIINHLRKAFKNVKDQSESSGKNNLQETEAIQGAKQNFKNEINSSQIQEQDTINEEERSWNLKTKGKIINSNR